MAVYEEKICCNIEERTDLKKYPTALNVPLKNLDFQPGLNKDDLKVKASFIKGYVPENNMVAPKTLLDSNHANILGIQNQFSRDFRPIRKLKIPKSK